MVRLWEEARCAKYDLAIFTCGYESRSTYIHDALIGEITSSLVLDYECEGEFDYDSNLDLLKAPSSSNVISIVAPQVEERLAAAIAGCQPESGSNLEVLFDVSSCSRSVMAIVLLTLSRSFGGRVNVSCVYALSAFENPPNGELPSSISEPVIGDLSGWSDDLTKPPCAIIGLGFEPGRALGSIDYLEVPEVRLFMPNGPDQRFVDAVVKANELLINEAGSGDILPYDILDTYSTYEKLDSLVYGLLPKFRPVIIPLGPKIFAALSIILAIRIFPAVCVWRTSAGSGEDASNRSAQGEVAVFRTSLPLIAEDQ